MRKGIVLSAAVALLLIGCGNVKPPKVDLPSPQPTATSAK